MVEVLMGTNKISCMMKSDIFIQSIHIVHGQYSEIYEYPGCWNTHLCCKKNQVQMKHVPYNFF